MFHKIFRLKNIFFYIFLFFSLNVKSQIISDTVLNINCYHDGAIYTQISSLNTSYFTKWFYSQDNNTWSVIDINNSNVILNNSTFNSDTLSTKLCGYYRLEVWNLNNMVTDKTYFIECALVATSSVDIINCFNDLGAIILNNINGGTSPYSFQWLYNNLYLPDTLFYIDSLSSGTYQAIITDSIGCSDTVLENLISPALLEVNYIQKQDVFCNQEATGKLFITVSGGRKISTYINYKYFLLNSADTIAFLDLDSITSNISYYNLSNQLDSIVIEGLYSDNYRLMIYDSSLCSIDTLLYINEPQPYQLYSSTSSLTTCSSDSIWFKIDSIKGGNMPYFYAIDDTIYNFITYDGNIYDSIYVSSGTHNIYILDTINFCYDTLSFFINSLYDIEVDLSINDVLCFGSKTGSIQIDDISGGLPPYNIDWNGGNNDSLLAGAYILEINDSISCLYKDTILINQPDSILITHYVESPTCNTDSNGYIALNVSGGIPPYHIMWNSSGYIGDTLFNLSQGFYSYSLRDSNNCILQDSILVSSSQNINIDFINYIDSLQCFNGYTSIEVLVNSSNTTYSIIWSNNDTSNITDIQAGINYCTIIDSQGCSYTDSIIILQPDTFKILDLIVEDTLCNNGVNAFVTTTGGTSPVSYNWSVDTLNSTQNITINDSITFLYVFVTDSCGNQDSAGININPFVLETELNYNDSNNTASVDVINTSSNSLIYLWENLRLDSIGTDSFLLINPCERIYYVSIIDSINGCIVKDTLNAFLYLPDSLVDLTKTSVIPDSSLWGFGPYTYLWDNGSTDKKAILCPGSHWVEVTDNSGSLDGIRCMVRQNFKINPLSISFNSSDLILNCDLQDLDVIIEAVVDGGTPPYNYEWSVGSTENPLEFRIQPGKYNIKITDFNNCISDTNFVINHLSADCVPNVFTPNGDNINDTWYLGDIFLFEESEVSVFGRYGKLIFNSKGNITSWDGKNKKGIDVPSGVYYYSISIGKGFGTIKGSVTILR